MHPPPNRPKYASPGQPVIGHVGHGVLGGVRLVGSGLGHGARVVASDAADLARLGVDGGVRAAQFAWDHPLATGVLATGGLAMIPSDMDYLRTATPESPSPYTRLMRAHQQEAQAMNPLNKYSAAPPTPRLGGVGIPSAARPTIKHAAPGSGKAMVSQGLADLVSGMFGRDAPAPALADVLSDPALQSALSGKSVKRWQEVFDPTQQKKVHQEVEQDLSGLVERLANRARAGSSEAQKQWDTLLVESPELAAAAAETQKRLADQAQPGVLRRYGAPGVLALGGVGLAFGEPIYDVAKPTVEAMGARVRDQLVPYHERTDVGEKAIESFATSLAGNLGQATSEALTGAPGSVMSAVNRLQGDRRLQALMSGDPILSQATDAERDLLHRAYGSMRSVAPTLAQDPFAATSMLRETLSMGTGPDYATIGNLARVERDLTGGK